MRSIAVPGRCNGGPSSISTATTAIVTGPESSLIPVGPEPPATVAAETAFSSDATPKSGCSLSVAELPKTNPYRSSTDVTTVVNTSPISFFYSKASKGSRTSTPKCTPRQTPTKVTPRSSAPVSPRLVLPEGPETDLTEINSLLVDINQLDNQAGGSACEGIPLCSLSPSGLTTRSSPVKSQVTPRPTPGHRRGGHSARGSLIEDEADPEPSGSVTTHKAAQVSEL
jgi:hypothetical protein